MAIGTRSSIFGTDVVTDLRNSPYFKTASRFKKRNNFVLGRVSYKPDCYLNEFYNMTVHF